MSGNGTSFLREQRINKGLSQVALAQKIQVRGATISRWEAGKEAPRPRHLKKLAKLFNIPIAELREKIAAQEQ